VTHALQLHINGQPMTLEASPADLLIDVLREQCHLTGTHQGCDTAQCGACTVLVNGAAIKSCNRLALQAQGQHITTIEGVAHNEADLHVMQQCFSKHHALQCGFCTPGFIMRALAMVHEDIPLTEQAIRHALSGNLCRCTGYEGIVQAVLEGLQVLRASKQEQV
jgi:carbon-monoxide dehydrogenase small subunit